MIRGLAGTKGRVRLVAVTASALPEDKERCLRAGMDDFMAKPVSWTALTDTISRLVESQRAG